MRSLHHLHAVNTDSSRLLTHAGNGQRPRGDQSHPTVQSKRLPFKPFLQRIRLLQSLLIQEKLNFKQCMRDDRQP